MKKLPMVVSAVMAFASGSGMLLARTVLADTETTQADILHTEANIYTGLMDVPVVRPAQNEIEFDTGMFPGSDDTTRIVFAQPNYEAGYGLGESDEVLAKLGEQEDGRLKVFYDQSFDENQQSPSWRLTFENDALVKNKADRVYYALEHGQRTQAEDGTTSWENVWWERGIIDYRSCIHAKNYDPETTICAKVYTDTNYQKYGFVVVEPRAWTELSQLDEEVLSWEEEWQQIRLEQAEALGDKVTELTKANDELTNKNAALERKNQDLEVKNGELEDKNVTLEMEMVDLKKEIASLRAENAGLKQENKSLQAENVSLRKENEDLRTKNAGLEKANAELRTEKADLEKRNEELMVENAKLVAMGVESDDDSQEDNVRVETQIVEKVRTEYVERQVASDDITKGTTNNAAEGVTGETKTDTLAEETKTAVAQDAETDVDNESMEVPRLGEVETNFNFWWLLIPGVVLMGLIVLALRRTRKSH